MKGRRKENGTIRRVTGSWAGRLGHAVIKRWRLLTGVAGFSACAAAGAFAWAYHATPLPASLQDSAPASYVILDRTGQPLRELLSPGQTYAGPLRMQNAPPALVHATLSAEDKRFYSHPGVDPLAVVRAVWQAVSRGEVHSGASTITMQLLKAADPRPRTLRTKLREALLAIKLERRWRKARILREYLSRIHYGHLRMGCVSAARYYFGKDLQDLSTAECAFLAGLPWAPTRLNPHTSFSAAKARQEWVLARMRENGYLSAAEFNRALREQLVLQPAGNTFAAPHFVDLLLQDKEVAARMRATPEQLQLKTTLDPVVQQFAETQLKLRLAPLRRKNVRNGAVVVLRNTTGEVLALVGSADYFAGRSGQVNGAWALRSPGSALKPFTYLLAMERGATPATLAPDIPTEFITQTGTYIPHNYDRRCYGPVRYRTALAASLNIAAVRVLECAGGPEALRTRLRAWGITSMEEDAVRYGLGLTIGNAEMRLLELANAYATLARLGRYLPVKFVADAEDPPLTVLTSASQAASFANARMDALDTRDVSAATKANAWLIADMLSDNFARTLTFGPRSWLYFDFPVAAKTGTSSEYRDNWCFGYTPEFTVGVWVGNFDGSPMQDVSGVVGAAPVMHDIMVELRRRYGTSWYERPAGIVERQVHPVTGKQIDPALAVDRTRHQPIAERFWENQLPAVEQATDYDAAGRLLLPSEYERWLASGDNWLAGQAALGGSDQRGMASARVPRIFAPLPGTHFYLDPDLPDQGSIVSLETDLAHARWSSQTLEIMENPQTGEPQVRLRAGRHEITATDPQTGKSASTWLQVEQL